MRERARCTVGDKVVVLSTYQGCILRAEAVLIREHRVDKGVWRAMTCFGEHWITENEMIDQEANDV